MSCHQQQRKDLHLDGELHGEIISNPYNKGSSDYYQHGLREMELNHNQQIQVRSNAARALWSHQDFKRPPSKMIRIGGKCDSQK